MVDGGVWCCVVGVGWVVGGDGGWCWAVGGGGGAMTAFTSRVHDDNRASALVSCMSFGDHIWKRDQQQTASTHRSEEFASFVGLRPAGATCATAGLCNTAPGMGSGCGS